MVLVVVSDDCTFHSLMLKVLPALAMGKKKNFHDTYYRVHHDSSQVLLFIFDQFKYVVEFHVNTRPP